MNSNAQVSEQGYWSERYQQQRTGWDAGAITTPLKTYIDQLTNKNMRILIPGAGNAYEAEYFHKAGFTQVYVLDIALEPLDNLRKRCPGFPEDHLLMEDFFNHGKQYDLILEQTFFCAIEPSRRALYAQQAASMLHKNGTLCGVLFDRQFEGGPPFGGSAAEYKAYFKPYFEFRVFEACYNSIPPREGTELFMNLQKL